MISFFVFLFAAVVLAEDPCPTNNINNFYRELNCEPIFENASKCPSSFDCPKFENRDKSKCSYKGISYEVGEHLPANISDPCFSNCICVKDSEEASFVCAIVDCPEIWSPPLPENCVRLHSPNSCCSTGTYCANETSEAITFTCEVDNKTYVEGQKFYPESEPCKRCYCKRGFEGKLVEPFCEDIPCSIELTRNNRLNENCIPIYYGTDGCCPISWKCPPAISARIISSEGNDTVTTTAKCTFGNLELTQFDVLEEDGLKCECVVPPYLTCFGG